jgi:TolB protein
MVSLHGGAWAQEPGPAVVITPGEAHAFNVAVQAFADASEPPDAERAVALRKAIEEGLEFSSVLSPLPDEAFLGEVQTGEMSSGFRSDCLDWVTGGADALVEGRMALEGQRLVIEYQVWDMARCQLLHTGAFQEPAKLLAHTGRLLADEIVKAFTGTPGVAATEIAFVSDRAGQREVYVMDADGGRQRPATTGDSIKAFPDWMPDGGAIVYTSYDDRELPGLYVTSRGNSRPGPILTQVLPGFSKYRGVFSPDGRKLAFVSSLDGTAELFSVDRSGKRLARLTDNRSIDIAPAWSPDGSHMAFVSDRSGMPQIYVMDDAGGAVRRLTYNGSYNTHPAWSPDGRWIAYETRVDGGRFDIWLIDPQGEVNVPLVTHPRSDESAAWSPDGRKIAFSSNRRGRSDIYVVDLDGSNLRRLTHRQGENLQPAWGPFSRQ